MSRYSRSGTVIFSISNFHIILSIINHQQKYKVVCLSMRKNFSSKCVVQIMGSDIYTVNLRYAILLLWFLWILWFILGLIRTLSWNSEMPRFCVSLWLIFLLKKKKPKGNTCTETLVRAYVDEIVQHKYYFIHPGHIILVHAFWSLYVNFKFCYLFIFSKKNIFFKMGVI